MKTFKSLIINHDDILNNQTLKEYVDRCLSIDYFCLKDNKFYIPEDSKIFTLFLIQFPELEINEVEYYEF